MTLLSLLADFFVKHRLLVALLIVALSVLAGIGFLPEGRRTQWESAKRKDDDARDAADRPRFSLVSSECTLVVEGEHLFTPRTVRALRAVARALQELDYVRRVVWIDELPVTNAFGLPELLLPREDVSLEHFQEAQRKALEHPLVGGQLLSLDGKTMLMPITFDWLYVADDADVTERLLQVARSAAKSAGGDDLRIRLTGNVPLYLAHQQSFDRNHYRFTIIGYVLVLMLALFMFRGVRAVLILAAAPALAIFWSTGILNLLNEGGNHLTNVVLPVLISMVGLTDGVHLLVHIRRRRGEGLDPVAASRSAIEHVGLACALTSFTTAIGFASLMLAKSEVIQGFGRQCAIGVMITFVAVITSIPLACSTFLGNNLEQGHERDFFGGSIRRLTRWFDFIVRRPRAVSLAGIAATVGLGIVAFQLRPDHTIQASQPTGSAAYQTLLHCDRAFGGVESLSVVVTWPEDQPDDAPQLVQALAEVEQVLAKEPLFSPPLSLNRILHIFPGDTGLTQRLPFMELLPVELKRMFMNREKREAYAIVRVQDLGIAKYEPAFQRVDSALADLSERYAGFQFRMVGQPVERGRELYQVVVDLAASLGTASVVILVVMSVVYRSLRLGLITIVPNLFPLALTGAVLYLSGHPLEIASVCSFTVCLGIAVDDTIHFLTRYQRDLQQGRPRFEAVRQAITGVGPPMIMTTFVLVVGFSTVMTSELPGQRTFAAMACCTIAGALIGDLVFLPAMLIYFAPRSSPASPQPPLAEVADSAASVDNEI